MQGNRPHGAGALARPDRAVRVACGAMPALAEVQEAFRTLPARYLGAEPGFDATYHIRLGDIGRTWEVRCTTHGARVRAGRHQPRPPTS